MKGLIESGSKLYGSTLRLMLLVLLALYVETLLIN